MILLNTAQVKDLCIYIEKHINDIGCNHSLKNTFDWAKQNGINKDDLIDILESHGGFCDCEVIMNLPEDCDLKLESNIKEIDLKNPFKIPVNFQQTENKIYSKAIFSSPKYGNNNYTKEKELLIPAPFGFKPHKRVKQNMHFFNGTESELPSEVGVVKEIEPMTAKVFAKQIRDLGLKSFEKFSEREAEYYFSRIEKIDIGKPMATHFMERRGIGGRKFELKIHKVIIRK